MTFYRLATGNPCTRYADGVHLMVDQGYSFDLCAEMDLCGCGLRRLGTTDEMRQRGLYEQGPPRAAEVLPGTPPGDQPVRSQGSRPALLLQGRVRPAPPRAEAQAVSTHTVDAVYVPIPTWECRHCARRWLSSEDPARLETLHCVARRVDERAIHWTWLHGPADRRDPSPRSAADERYRRVEDMLDARLTPGRPGRPSF